MILLTGTDYYNTKLMNLLNQKNIKNFSLPLIETSTNFDININLIQESQNLIIVSYSSANSLYQLKLKFNLNLKDKLFFVPSIQTASFLKEKLEINNILYNLKGESSEYILPLIKKTNISNSLLLLAAENGREYLKEKTNCNVLHIYKKKIINQDKLQIIFDKFKFHKITFISQMSLESFSQIIKERDLIVFVPSKRLKNIAKSYGYLNVINCNSANVNIISENIIKFNKKPIYKFNIQK